jgi:ABC-type multidrug transport system fused ATPase/permease subunit
LSLAPRQRRASFADEVAFLQRGTIAARGPHEQLVADNDAYVKLISAYDPEASAQVGQP